MQLPIRFGKSRELQGFAVGSECGRSVGQSRLNTGGIRLSNNRHRFSGWLARRQLGTHKHQEIFFGSGYLVLPNRWKTCCACQAVGKCNVDRDFFIPLILCSLGI